MQRTFDELMEKGTPESITEAYEQLWAHEKRGVPILYSSEAPAMNITLDVDRLEKIALTPTALEYVTAAAVRFLHYMESYPRLKRFICDRQTAYFVFTTIIATEFALLIWVISKIIHH